MIIPPRYNIGENLNELSEGVTYWKSLLHKRNPDKKMERLGKATDWEKMFAEDIFDRGLLPKIHTQKKSL